MDKNRNKKNENNEIIQALALFTQIGITMAVTLFISVLIGKFIDDKFGTTPIFIMVFSVLGIFASFRNLYEITKKHWKK